MLFLTLDSSPAVFSKSNVEKSSENFQLLSFEKPLTLIASALQEDQNERSQCSI